MTEAHVLLQMVLAQVVPLPFAEQQPGQQCSSSQAPVEPVVLAAQSAAAAAPLQPFEVRQLPYRAYAVVLTDRWVHSVH
jgi:hypothetical protein